MAHSNSSGAKSNETAPARSRGRRRRPFLIRVFAGIVRLFFSLFLLLVILGLAVWAGSASFLQTALQSSLPPGWSGGLGFAGIGWNTFSLRNAWVEMPSGARLELDGMTVSGLHWSPRTSPDVLGIDEISLDGMHLIVSDWAQLEALPDELQAMLDKHLPPGSAVDVPAESPKNWKIRRFSLAGLNIQDGLVSLQKEDVEVGCSLISNGGTWEEGQIQIHSGSLRLSTWGIWQKPIKEKELQVRGLETKLEWPSLTLEWPGPEFEGAGSLASLQWGPYQAHDLAFKTRGDLQRLLVEPLSLTFEGTSLRGRLLVEQDSWGANPGWRVEGRLRRLDVARLISIMKWEEYAQAEGVWDIDFDCAGVGKKLVLVDIDGKQRSGSRGWLDIRSADQLLSRLPLVQVERIKPILEKTRQYAIEQGSIQIRHLGDAKPSIQLMLEGPSGKRLLEFRIESVDTLE